MKETQYNPKDKLEISVKQKKQAEHQLIGNIEPYDGHKMWEINHDTLEVKQVKFTNVNYVMGVNNKKEILMKDGHSYVAALNAKNAMKKYKQNRNGAREVITEPLKLFL